MRRIRFTGPGARLGVACLGLALSVACKRDGERQDGSQPSPLATPAGLPAPVASGLPGDLAGVSGVVNPKGEKAYSGPTGTVRGRVTATGDLSVTREDIAGKVPPDCANARGFYGPALREGPNRSLADAVVAVTDYQGYVPAREPRVRLEASDCNFGTRTVALTFGQRLEVVSKDARSYVPELLGSNMKAQLVATPYGKGKAELFPTAPGSYVLIDNLRLFMTAEVLVLKYSTHDVTGLDGTYEIPHVPAGKITVSVFFPGTGATEQKKVELAAGQTLELDFALPFDAKKYESERAAALAKAQGSAAPAASR